MITDVGFQLSYLAVLGLLVFQPVLINLSSSDNKYIQKTWYYLSASIAAQVITFPLSAYYFHQFPLYFLISNLFIIIPSELILMLGLSAIILPQIPYLSNVVFWLLEKTILMMNAGLKLIEQQPFSSIDKIWLTLVDCILLTVAIAILFYFLHSGNKLYLKLCILCFFIVSISIDYKQIKSVNTNSITFYSLNKHSSILFKNGNAAVLVSDIDQTDPVYNYSIRPCIDSNRVDNLQIINTNNDYNSNYFKKRNGLIQFRDKRILIIDNVSTIFRLKKTLLFNYLYLTGNPHLNLALAQKKCKFEKLIIDGTNSAANIKKLKTEAEELKINYAILKRNNSFVVLSN